MVKRLLRAGAVRDLLEHVLSPSSSILLAEEIFSIALDRTASSHGAKAHCQHCWFYPIHCQGCPRLNCFLGFVGACVCVCACVYV